MKDIDRIIENLLNLDKGMYVEGMGREAAAAISDLTKRLEQALAIARNHDIRDNSEGSHVARSIAESLEKLQPTLLSREHASERQLPRDPLANNPTDSDENAP